MSLSLASNFDQYNRRGYFDNYVKQRTNVVRIDKSIEIINKYQELCRGDLKLLDVGCGDGQISVRFKNVGLQVYGVEIVDIHVNDAITRGIKAIKANFEDKLPF